MIDQLIFNWFINARITTPVKMIGILKFPLCVISFLRDDVMIFACNDS